MTTLNMMMNTAIKAVSTSESRRTRPANNWASCGTARSASRSAPKRAGSQSNTSTTTYHPRMGQPRPAYRADVGRHRIGALQAVVCWHTDRLTRRPIEGEQFMDLVARMGIERNLATATGEIDLIHRRRPIHVPHHGRGGTQRNGTQVGTSKIGIETEGGNGQGTGWNTTVRVHTGMRYQVQKRAPAYTRRADLRRSQRDSRRLQGDAGRWRAVRDRQDVERCRVAFDTRQPVDRSHRAPGAYQPAVRRSAFPPGRACHRRQRSAGQGRMEARCDTRDLGADTPHCSTRPAGSPARAPDASTC